MSSRSTTVRHYHGSTISGSIHRGFSVRMSDGHRCLWPSLRDAKDYIDDQARWAVQINPRGRPPARRRRNPMAVHHIDHAAYPARCRTLSDAALRHIIKDATAAIRAMPDGHKAGYYADEINYCSDELNARKRGSRRNPVMMNPTRTGTPTRGELRKVKFLDYLRAVREKGKKAEMQLKRLTGKGKIDLPPVLRADKTETQLEHPGHYADELTSDAKFVKAQVDSIELAMADVRDQLRGLGDDDEALADELTAQLVKLGKQKTTLRGTLVATNPRRRRMLTDRPGYRTALRSWIKVLRSAPVGASGVKRETRSRRRRR